MKNALDFNIQFSNLMGRSFPNCFAGVYVYLENNFAELPKKCGNKQNYCFGCGCSREPQSAYFVLFDTLCGRSSLYWRLDGELTNIGKLVDDDNRRGSWASGGTDYTVDFLFGLAGYEYQKITDNSKFKDEIIASVNANKPIIAELVTGKEISLVYVDKPLTAELISGEGYCVITGFEDEKFISCFYHTDQSKNTQEKCMTTLSSDEIETIYTIGSKIAARYTLKNGLERIKQVIEGIVNEAVWDDGIEYVNKTFINPTDDEFAKMSAAELKALEEHVKGTFQNQFNSHIFGAAISHFPKIYDKNQYPELAASLDKLKKCIAVLQKYAFNKGNVLGVGSPRAELGEKLIKAIKDINKTYAKMLIIIDQATLFLK